jgi:hypothetical protein
MKFQAKMCIRFLVAVIGMVCVSNALAVLDIKTYGFYNITHNSINNAAAGEAQLAVAVSDRGSMTTGDGTFNLVGFKFNNSGPVDCVITDIYFQDGSFLGFASIDESLPGVDFKQDEIGNIGPENLPGGNSMTPAFISTTLFSMEPVNPGPYWGVGPAEWVEIVYSLQAGKTYADIIDELDSADLRIGIHVQSFADDGSESFVNVPEPMALILLGLGGLTLRKRRK